MKLTWFGGTTLRVHIGGRILVCDPRGIQGIDGGELVSGADRVFRFDEALPELDPARWQPRRAGALINDDALVMDVLLHRLAPGAVLLDAAGAPPLVLLNGPVPAAGRWARDAVAVAFGADAAASALEVLAPRLIALALPEPALEATFAALRDRLNGTALVALESGMALEV
jgi:hypothetical protein